MSVMKLISKPIKVFTLALSLMLPIEVSADVNATLIDALSCKAKDPAASIDQLIDKGSQFDQGYAVAGIGEDIDYQRIVILKKSLVLEGAKTKTVVASTNSPYENFAAFVYGKFTGDYQKVVKQYSLKLAKTEADKANGKYVSQFQPKDTCPPIMMLTPLEGNTFLVGCGWCNGG